jgi:glutamine amidotransferase
MQKIAVIDYGMGNLRSVSKALESVAPNAEVIVSANLDQVLSADRVVFPGQGAIGACMAELNDLALTEVVKEVAATKPFFGICIGMQLLLTHSEENGGVDGLDIFSGNVQHFELPTAKDGSHLKVPHMGWNQVHQMQSHPLWADIDQDSRFYFVHSYYATADDAAVVAGTTAYPDAFASVLARENVFATQFHPEKSAHAGLQLLKNFVNWQP